MRWFIILMFFFLLANIAGLIRPMGLLPYRYIGFPFTFLTLWGGDTARFEVNYAVINAVIALLTSIGVSYIIKRDRGVSVPVSGNEQPS